jgi:hypothetical protein
MNQANGFPNGATKLDERESFCVLSALRFAYGGRGDEHDRTRAVGGNAAPRLRGHAA